MKQSLFGSTNAPHIVSIKHSPASYAPKSIVIVDHTYTSANSDDDDVEGIQLFYFYYY